MSRIFTDINLYNTVIKLFDLTEIRFFNEVMNSDISEKQDMLLHLDMLF